MRKNAEQVALFLCCVIFCHVAAADDWPQWRGPNRDGISGEKGLLRIWPKEGPPLLRTIGDIGEGSSSPVIAKGHLFITGNSNQVDSVHCIALDGKRLWSAKNGSARGARAGAQGSVTVDGVSLTVVEPLTDGFTVAVIPHTSAVTTLGHRRPGDQVNLEVDIIAKYTERLLTAEESP